MTAMLTSRLAAALVGVVAALLLAQGGPDATLATADTPAPRPAMRRALTSPLSAAARTPAPAPRTLAGRPARRDPARTLADALETPGTVVTRADGAPAAGGPSPTPGPDTRPLPQGTTVLPFPVPGDRSGEVSERMQQMNVPREGLTLSQPLAPGAGSAPVITTPEVLQGAAPEYPDAAFKAGLQGTVVVRARVLVNGSVGEASVVRSVPGLDDAALAAVRQYRFRPARGPNGPLAAWVMVPIRFTLH